MKWYEQPITPNLPAWRVSWNIATGGLCVERIAEGHALRVCDLAPIFVLCLIIGINL